AQGERVQVQVQDNGPGIAPEMRARLFEPFATSKPAGAGLGLGLTISQRIVRSFGGELGVCETTDPDCSGACFCIDLPACTVVPAPP
ncbi:MAG: ATP-binding protein, partial [Burkholderiaceae bacterium]|nr:ATP-binding protein [Burkholderiaceae bacterium]